MSVVPDAVDTDVQPPLAIPLKHFVVGLCLLLGAGALGVASALGGGGFVTLGHVHLLLAGWVCVTIAGAMTQFVPVWSGVRLHSKPLARIQLALITVGVLGVVAGFLTTSFSLLALSGNVLLVGFWVFAYNVGRTLARARPFDVTERHFALALGFFVVLTVLGLLLALDFTTGVLGSAHGRVLEAHATLAVFGAVGTTVAGALYQLATMFTQVDLDAFDERLQRVEEIDYPVGVVALAVGRYADVGVLARAGGVLVAVGLFLVGVVVLRCLARTRVGWTPMLRRYAVAGVAMVVWAVLAASQWVREAVGVAVLFGRPGSLHLLFVGVVGFVVLGTLYHVVPFLIWVHRYSDRLGLEPVPMIDDLYDGRLAHLDFALTVSGAGVWVGAELLALDPTVAVVGSLLLVLGFVVFVANIGRTIWVHSPGALASRFERTDAQSAD